MAVAGAAAATAIGTNWLICPVCHEDFSHPKILPCTHLVCRDCVLTQLRGDHLASCPLCLTSILPEETQEQCDLDLFVDDLATDLVTMAKVEVQSALSGDDVCVCDSNAVATTFCVQCYVKLCAACAKVHSRLPATQTHHLQDPRTLNPDELLRHRPPAPCHTHPHMPSHLFCPRHQQLICITCASSAHGECPGVVSVTDGARCERAKLREQIERLKEKTRKLDAQIQTQAETDLTAEATFKPTRNQVAATFHKLHQTLEVRRQDLLDQLKQRETSRRTKASVSKHLLEKHKGMLKTFTDLAERLVGVADEFLLTMFSKLKPRLDEAEARQAPDGVQADETGGAIVDFDTESFEELVEKIAAFGAVNERRRSSEGSDWVFVDSDGCPQQDSAEDHPSHPRPPVVRQRSIPCSQCADDIVALDNGDLYTCHGCTRMWLRGHITTQGRVQIRAVRVSGMRGLLMNRPTALVFTASFSNLPEAIS